MTTYANASLSAYYLWYFARDLAAALSCTVSYWDPTTQAWCLFSAFTAAYLIAATDATVMLYYKAIDSSSKIKLRLTCGAAGALVMSGTWVKIFNLIPSTSITYTTAAGGTLDVTLMTEGITLINVHANFGKCQLISKYNSSGFMASDILCSVPVTVGQNDLEQYINAAIGGEVPYLNNSLSEVELYFSDEWFTILTDLEPYHLTLTFSHQDKKQPAERNTTKRARKHLGHGINNK